MNEMNVVVTRLVLSGFVSFVNNSITKYEKNFYDCFGSYDQVQH
jgi:hypothetical protein